MSHHSYTKLESETIAGLTTNAKDNLVVEYDDTEDTTGNE